MLLQYLDDKSQIKDALRMAEIGLTSAWTLDDFKVAIAKYISSPPMSDTNVKFVFEELLERAREKEGKEAKKCKRLADEFYELLHASKEITASSKWEDCKSLFGDRIMGDEGLLLEIFDKFVNEVKEKERKRQEDKSPYIEMMKNNFFFFRSSTNDANKTPSPPLKSKEVSSWRSVSLPSRSL
ncbi:pre-mRNA-processing protein 40A-like [Capsicum galapagoense]